MKTDFGLFLISFLNDLVSILKFHFRGRDDKRREGEITMKTAEPGSISSGTMREKDLIPCFCDRLEELAQDNYPLDGVVEHLEKVKEIRGRMGESYWNSEESEFDLDDLFDALDEYAPEGYRFGAHPGDGTDYGFWQWEEV